MTAAKLLLRVGTATDDEPEFVNDLTWDLIETLKESPADSVERPPADVPDGAKGTALEWAQLAVSFSGGLPVIVGLIRAWVGRRPDAKVRIELDGDSLELDNASPELQDQLARAFLSRHAPPVPE
jgi:Effector Associated Constant Component 1